jgi:hypothetical protein
VHNIEKLFLVFKAREAYDYFKLPGLLEKHEVMTWKLETISRSE